MHLFLFSIPHFPYQAINFPLWLPTPTCSSYCASPGSAGCYTFLLSHLPSHPYGINSPKALVLKKCYFKMIKYVWQSVIDQWCLRVIFLQISLMFVYMCVYMVVSLFIYLFNHIYGYLLCAMYCTSSFTCVISFGGLNVSFTFSHSLLHEFLPKNNKKQQYLPI